MKFNITSDHNYSLASITQPKSDIAQAIITVDIHSHTTVATDAIHTILPDTLLSGAGTYSRDAFLEAVNLLGASIEVDISNGRCTFALKSTATTFPKLLKLFEVMLMEPTFSATELKRVQSTNINQLHQAKEDSKAIANEKLQNVFYGSEDRKYSYSIDECIEGIKKSSVQELKKCHQLILNTKWYATVGGDKKTVEALKKTLTQIKQKAQAVTPDAIHQPKPAKPVLSLEEIPSRQNIDLSIGLPLPITNQHPDYIPLVFAVAILGKWGGFTGRLMSTVREKEGLTYGIYARLEGFTATEYGHLRIMTFFAPNKTIQGLKSTFREISLLFQKGVTQAEVDTFKIILGTQQTMLQDSIGRLLGDLHSYHFQDFSLAEMEAYKARFAEVTRADINRVIKTYLDPQFVSISGAGPTKAVQKELRDWFKTV